MVYKAIKPIGEYKPGDIVPDEQAKIWLKRYLVPQVEFVGKEEPKPEKPVEEEKPKDNFDFDGNGDVDEKDRSLAAKLMGSKRGKKKKGKKR